MTKPIDSAAFIPGDEAHEGAVEGVDPLAFTPVPVAARHLGWSAERQRLFIRTLAETACVSEACDAAGVSPRSAYRLRVRAGAESFDRAWRQALVIGVHRLTTLAFERAIHGTARKVWHKGEVVGEEFVPSDRLLMYLLKHYDRARYGNLSGLMPIHVPDPMGEASEALPAALATLTDHATPPNADEHECFTILRQLEDDGA